MKPDFDPQARMVQEALSVVGLEAADPNRRAEFEELLGPPRGGWGLDLPYGKGGVSTCAMVALGLLRRLGVAIPEIEDGYDVGTGLRVLIDFARRLQPRPAWITPIPGLLPHPGDIVQLLGPMHVLTVVDWVERGGVLQCVSVDGGQVGTRGLQAIHRCTRPWREESGGPRLGGRVVDGWVAIDLLPYRSRRGG